mmetsp:Transcript_19996/g.34380  ORF Transcript_19996/g.34380 Transcript_19996/m.34380 type:complete len:233 (+) Transcript_19996:869-1567(+)
MALRSFKNSDQESPVQSDGNQRSRAMCKCFGDTSSCVPEGIQITYSVLGCPVHFGQRRQSTGTCTDRIVTHVAHGNTYRAQYSQCREGYAQQPTHIVAHVHAQSNGDCRENIRFVPQSQTREDCVGRTSVAGLCNIFHRVIRLGSVMLSDSCNRTAGPNTHCNSYEAMPILHLEFVPVQKLYFEIPRHTNDGNRQLYDGGQIGGQRHLVFQYNLYVLEVAPVVLLCALRSEA